MTNKIYINPKYFKLAGVCGYVRIKYIHCHNLNFADEM